ncbi:hypothetical protein ACFY4C_42265 [Actinomadura viridis]|uniref:hypothetical protein n=1 Tax=Actinomadura viridis TaxID=58110 RepID=UPI0036A65E22
MRPRVTLSPALDAHVLTISHRHGDDTTVHLGHEDARSALAEYARQWWDEITGGRPVGGGDIPQSPDGLDDDTVITIYFRRDDEDYSITEATMLRPAAPSFELDEAKARAFLHRALRRYDGTLPDGEGGEASRDEDWTLEPGWDTDSIFSDELSHVENLVYQAIHVVGAITLTPDSTLGPEDVDIEPVIEAVQGGDWAYQWRVSLPIGVPFALCSPYREEFRRLGWTDKDIKAKGCRSAMGILREAVAAGNQILAAYTDAGGRIPTAIA